MPKRRRGRPRDEERRRLAALAAIGSPYEVIDQEARARVVPEPPKAPTFNHVADLYVDHHLPTLKPSTAQNYPYTINRWLRRILGDEEITAIDYDKAQAVETAVRKAGNVDGSVRSVGTVLRSILCYAVARDILIKVPDLPKLTSEAAHCAEHL